MDPTPQDRTERRRAREALKRERDVLLLYGAAFRDIPHIDEATPHLPRPSLDPTLTALCQLTAIRLGAQRAMISLLDEQRQHILAEATCDLSLRPEAPGDAASTLWLGNLSIPRKWGLCEQVIDLDPKEEPVLVVQDLAQDSRTCLREDVRSNQHMRFYASAALLSPNGVIVGSLCIFDSKPRDGLSQNEIDLLRSLASTVMAYLNTYTTKDQYRRGERFTRGLVSFVEGASDLLPFEKEQPSQSPAQRAVPTQLPVDTASSTDHGVKAVKEDATSAADPTKPKSRTASQSPRQSIGNHTESSRHQSIRKLQDTILPMNSKSMFTRAANLMMASSHLDGVVILDASVAVNGNRNTTTNSGSGTDAAYESHNSISSSSDELGCAEPDLTQRRMSSATSKACQVLGVATTPDGAGELYGKLAEQDLSRLFHEYPNGKIFAFAAGGQSMSSTEEGSVSSGTNSEQPGVAASPKRGNNKRSRRGPSAVQAMFPNARSVAFIPFWDYERSRWFAGCLCWSNDPYRLLSASVDLAYFKIFSHSIMRELSRLDAIALNEAKTTFVASISHELRSPLHGILGTLEFIKDTPLDSFQTSMLNSLNACGVTLLDTINHVMDYAKMSETSPRVSTKRLKNSNTICLSSKPLKNRRNKEPAFDFALATEEVVEAVFSGSSYSPVASKLLEAPQSPTDETSNPFSTRKLCFIALDIAHEDDWVYSFPVGSWRRIVMNLFGNAVKYTGSGFIQVSLRANRIAENTGTPNAIILTVTDSGSGMSPAFLANKAFQPFSQEDSHAPGTGLGLNIVRTIIDTNGGKIEISSDPLVGTKLTVKLALSKPDIPNLGSPERAQFLDSLPRIEGRKICILHKSIGNPSSLQNIRSTDNGLLRFTNALAMTLETHLKMKVVQTTEWEGHDADIVICPELSFEYLAAIRRQRVDTKKAAVTIFVAMDAMEAATLRSDVRVTNKESVVEIITQPCGPYKLAFILNKCLDRFERAGENLEHTFSAAATPENVLPRIHGSQEPSVMLKSLHIEDSVGVTPPTPPPTVRTYSATGSNFTEATSTLFNEDDSLPSHVLITDDNLLNRKLLVAFMRKQGLQYLEARNGLEALLTYQKGEHKIDVILMDMSMPVMDGMSATRAIREFERERNMPRCSIIALTGLASTSAKLEAWSSGIDHFMTKPVNFKALGELLRKDEMKRQERLRDGGRGDVGTILEVRDLDVKQDGVS